MKQLTDKLSKRIIELDVIRAIAVFLMVFDHFFFDMCNVIPMVFKTFPRELYEFSYDYLEWDFREIFRYVVLFVFFSISGICCSFSKNNINRGLKLLGIALVLTLVTYIAGDIMNDKNFTITFGVLHCISVSLLLIGLLEKLKVNKYLYLIIGVLMVSIGAYFLLSKEYCYLGKCYVDFDSDPSYLVAIKQILGIKKYGGDSFPLLFNGGQIFICVFVGKLLYANKKSLLKNKQYKNNIVTLVGRNSLIVYFAHQIIIPIVIGIILLVAGYKLNI